MRRAGGEPNAGKVHTNWLVISLVLQVGAADDLPSKKYRSIARARHPCAHGRTGNGWRPLSLPTDPECMEKHAFVWERKRFGSSTTVWASLGVLICVSW